MARFPFPWLGHARTAVADVIDRFEPWAIRGFTAMFLSGIILVLAEPLKVYAAFVFRSKLQVSLPRSGHRVPSLGSLLAGALTDTASPVARKSSLNSQMRQRDFPRAAPAILANKNALTIRMARAFLFARVR